MEMQTTPSTYRPEIDGIRAIAVLSVMLFHAGVPGVSGGFLGVDIFFVISGFLITGQIVNEAHAGQFSILSFYLRRIRRILPALVVLCLLTLPAAFFLMLPDDLENYGQSLVATGLSANNVLLFITSDYFALETLYKPLVHTWSLGVEEQYYFIVPLMLAFAIRLSGRTGALTILLLATLASFACALVLGQLAPTLLGLSTKPANFYLLPSRFWELGLGGLAMLAQARLVRLVGPAARRIIAAAGIAMILGAMVVIGSDPSLPGWQTLFPTIGTALLLMFGDAQGVGTLLSSPPARWLGLISYSVYLYHQPVFAFLRLASLDEPSWQIMAASMLPTLVLGWLSWRFVERPFRDRRKMPDSRVLAFTIIGTSFAMLAGLAVHQTSGFRARWPELADGDPLFGANQNAAYVQAQMALNGKPFASPDRHRNVLVVGDSYARDFLNMANETGSLSRFSVSYMESYLDDAACADPTLPARILDRARDADQVVLSTMFHERNISCLADTIRRLEAAGVTHVVLLGTKNFGFNNNAIMHIPAARRYAWRVRPLAQFSAENRAAAAAISAKNYVDLLGLIDNGSGTIPVFTPERKFISQDRRHLTRAGARFVGEKVFNTPQFVWRQR